MTLKGRVLDKLQRNPRKGVTSFDLMLVGGLRFGGRVHELRQDGHVIECELVRTMPVRVHRYWLRP